jgi:hypothetical protein
MVPTHRSKYSFLLPYLLEKKSRSTPAEIFCLPLPYIP